MELRREKKKIVEKYSFLMLISLLAKSDKLQINAKYKHQTIS